MIFYPGMKGTLKSDAKPRPTSAILHPNAGIISPFASRTAVAREGGTGCRWAAQNTRFTERRSCSTLRCEHHLVHLARARASGSCLGLGSDAHCRSTAAFACREV